VALPMDRKHPSNYEIIRKNKGYGKGDKVDGS